MRRTFYMNSLEWTVEVYCLKPSFDPTPILSALREYSPKDKDMLVASRLMRSGDKNWGFTFSSYRQRASLMVIGPAENQAEYFDTIVHETYHLAKHIAQCDDLDPFSEDVAYIAGDMVKMIYGSFRNMVCLCKGK